MHTPIRRRAIHAFHMFCVGAQGGTGRLRRAMVEAQDAKVAKASAERIAATI